MTATRCQFHSKERLNVDESSNYYWDRGTRDRQTRQGLEVEEEESFLYVFVHPGSQMGECFPTLADFPLVLCTQRAGDAPLLGRYIVALTAA